MAGRLALETRCLLLALQYFTRLPVPRKLPFSQGALDRALMHLPLVGLLVGGLQALVHVGAAALWAPGIAVALTVLTGILVTGGLHEGGLADVCDGFFAGRDRAGIFRILREPTIGTFGVLGLILVLLLRFQALAAFGPGLLLPALLGAQAFSRLLALWLMQSLPYAQEDPGKTKPGPGALRLFHWLWAAAWGLGPLLVLGQAGLLAGLAAAIVALVFRVICKRKIGGYTGDCLGALQQISEVTIYLGLLL